MSEQRWGGPATCDAERLSAYRDGELGADDQQALEEHLGHCRYCRSILRQYAVLGSLLAEETQEAVVPATLGAELERRIAAQARQRRSPIPRWAGAALAAAAVFVLSLALGLFWPGRSLPVAAAYPAPQATNVPVQTAIQVEFKGAVDQAEMASAVHVLPPVAVEPVWLGNMLVLRPKEPLRPGTQYTVTIQTSAAGRPAQPVVVTSFRTGGADLVAAQAATAAPAATAPSLTQSANAVPTTTAGATVGQQCAETPSGGFGKLYMDNAGVRRTIGCPTEAEHTVAMAEESFQNGYMIWREDTRTIYVLRNDGSWSSYADTWREGMPSTGGEKPPTGSHAPERGFGKIWRETAGLQAELGWAMAPERGFNGRVQSFERGLMLWSDARWITILYTNGAWQRFADTAASPTTTAVPRATAALTATLPLTATGTVTPVGIIAPTATVTPTSTVAVTPTAALSATIAAGCPITPTGGFGLIYNGQDRVRAALGCPSEEEHAIPAAEEDFQGGTMYWRGDLGRIYVMLIGGGASVYTDTFKEGDPISGSQVPPPGLHEPVRGFGKVWRESSGLAPKLGWALEKEQGQTATVQTFAHGVMLSSVRKRVYVIYDDGSWERFDQ